jgi:hypothetical protein
MLDRAGREAYSSMSQQTCNLIDHDRARNEIALVDTKSGRVSYGIDSLFRVIANAFPILAPLFGFSPFRWLMKRVYAFISYNRKVIVPSPAGQGACVPDVNRVYRWSYIVFAWPITSIILMFYAQRMVGVIPTGHPYREFLICGGQVVFQALVIVLLNKNKILTYLGNMMTISLAGALLLLLLVGVASVLKIHSPLIYTLVFLMVAGLMLAEHLRRMRLLQIGWQASAGWVLYRLLVLCLIL